MLPQKLRCKPHSTVRNSRPHSAGTAPTFFVSSAPHGLRPGLRIRSMRHIASDGWNGTADTSRMLKKASSCVLASLESSTYGTKYVSCSRSLRPCWKTFLNILQAFCQGHGSCCPQASPSTERVFQHPAGHASRVRFVLQRHVRGESHQASQRQCTGSGLLFPDSGARLFSDQG